VVDSIPVPQPEVIHVKLVGHPEWMPRTLVRDIVEQACAGAPEFRDAGYARFLHDAAESNPWVREVKLVRKELRGADAEEGYVEIHARFRSPAARVTVPGPRPVALTDAEGVRLPDRADVPTGDLLLIQGVQGMPPGPGEAWNAADLRDGLRLVELLRHRTYADQITAIDVRNHNGRADPHSAHLRLFAQIGTSRPTEVRFGRFPAPGGDYVVPPARKMSELDRFVAENGGRLAGTRRWVNLQYDQLETSLD
jgi:hypothetical protein